MLLCKYIRDRSDTKNYRPVSRIGCNLKMIMPERSVHSCGICEAVRRRRIVPRQASVP